MNDTTFTRERSDGMRASIVEHVETAASTGSRRKHRLLTLITATGAGLLLLGGGLTAASAAGLIGWPFGSQNPLPGGDTAAVVPRSGDTAGDALSGAVVLLRVGRGAAEIALPSPPGGATHLSVQVTCLTPDSFSWGLDPVDNPSIRCGAADIESGAARAWYDFPVDGDTTTLYVGADADAQWRISAVFLMKETTEWAVNEHGQTYGVLNDQGSPDLVAVVATNGAAGYAYADELAEADGTAAAETFDSPADALRWQEERKGTTFTVTVYESDGETVIGEFVIQG